MAMADSKEKEEEQARKAHELAEKCFLAGNVTGARQWMQSAVRLAPDLPGTPQIVAAYDVHAAAARRSPTDWYAVLGLNPGGGGVTHDDIKKQHRRLCLLVHPDKNPCAAADGAFMLVQAASRALLAKHPPPGTAVPARARANQPAPPPPPPQQRQATPPTPSPRAPEPQPRPRPQVVQMARRPAPPPTPRPAAPTPPTYSQQAKQATKPAQSGRRRRGSTPPRPRFTSPIANKCPVCGARVVNGGGSNYRCMNCEWSPMDGRHDDDYGDDFFDY